MRLDPNKNPIYVVLFAALVSGAFTAGIMALHVATKPIVQEHERLLEQKALVELFNLGDPKKMTDEQIARVVLSRIAGYNTPTSDKNDLRRRDIFIEDPKTHKKIRLLVAFKHDLPPDKKPDIHDKKDIVAYAFDASGIGFWARIDALLAVTPDCRETFGFVVLNQSETPGLGGRITEPEWKDQFRPHAWPGRKGKHGLDISKPLTDEHFVFVTQRPPDRSSRRYDRHIDALTGATATSNAVGKFLNADIAGFHRAAEAAGLFKAEGGD